MFQANDRFRVKDSGLEGTINAVSFNSIYQETEYYVTWDAFPEKGQCCHTASNVDSIWEKVTELKKALDAGGYNGDPGIGYINQDPDILPRSRANPNWKWGDEYEVKKECDHKWVEIGFMHTKMVCKHCDIEQK